MQGFATGLVYGDQVTLEYYLPKKVKEIGVISISGIVHGYKYILPKFGHGNVPGNGFNLSGSCNININCPEGNNWQNEKRAVALILVNGVRMCTGSLINNTNNDNSPYFLTADHCLVNEYGSKIYDAINNPNLDDWIFYWNYELPPNPNDCNYNNSTPTAPLAFSTSGAQVSANNQNSDFALLTLTEDPEFFSNQTPSFTPYYLGWDRTGTSGTGGVGIHHPSGDVKKITPYIITPQSTAYLSGTVNANESHWRVTWNLGTTEGGSSGSPLINNAHRIIGQLHGGYASCSAQTQPDWYGKFNVSWTGNNATDSRRRLRDWLDPNNTNVTTLDGITSSCPTVNFTGQTVSTNRTVTGCDIYVKNVTVTGNAKLTLDATNSTTIDSDFEVRLGAELEIR